MKSQPVIVLHVVGGNDSAGGVMSFLRELVSKPTDGCSNLIWKHYTYREKGDPFIRLGWARYIDRSVFGDLLASLKDVIPLFFWARKQKRLILYAHSRMGMVIGCMVSKLTSIPLFVHVHGAYKTVRLYRALWRWAGAIVVFNSKKTCLHYGAKIAESHIICPFITWPNAPAKSKPSEYRFIAAGAFVSSKNFHVVIEAFQQLTAQSSAQLFIFGLSRQPIDPQYQNKIVEQAKTDSRIVLVEYDFNWTEQLTQNDVFVHAAERESFGIVILEAFAKGCK
ncbi:MAG: glycosyltransferase, partial [Limisphaerales bacterium]